MVLLWRKIYSSSWRWGRGWISLLCKYTHCGPYQVLLLYILIYATLFLGGNGTNQNPRFLLYLPYLSIFMHSFFCLFFKKGGQRITKQAAKHMVFGIPLWKNRLLILTGIVCLHSTTNAPFTVVTPNRAYQISHTLGKSNQHAKEKTAVCPT